MALVEPCDAMEEALRPPVHSAILTLSFVAAVEYSALRYYRVHKRAHREPGWAREHLPWHYDHHMGPNQDANWCVSWPWFDWVMGTREHYVGTARDRRAGARS